MMGMEILLELVWIKLMTTLQTLKKAFVSPYVSTIYMFVSLGIFLFRLCKCVFKPRSENIVIISDTL